jgi:hypothetical protein
MAMLTKSQKLVFISGAWMLLALTLLTLLRMLSYEYYFVLCLAGFTLIVMLRGPFTVKPAWRSRVNVVLVLGALAFVAIVVKEVLDIVGIRLFS